MASHGLYSCAAHPLLPPPPPSLPPLSTLQEQPPGLGMARHTLQQGKGVAHAVAGLGRQGGGREHRVDGNNFLKESGHGPDRVPEDGSQVRIDLALLA